MVEFAGPNAKATEQSLKGDDRSKFMSACLKKKV